MARQQPLKTSQPLTASPLSPQASAAAHAAHLFRLSGASPFERTNPQTQSKLVAALTALGEGIPLHFGNYPDGVHRRLALVRNLGKKGLIAQATRYNKEIESSFLGLPSRTLIFFPTASDAACYLEAGALSYRDGPSDLYPGSVGIVEMLYDVSLNMAQITTVQSSVDHRKSAVQTMLQREGRNLGKKYLGWADRLVAESLAFARRAHISRISIGRIPHAGEDSSFATIPEDAFPLTTRPRNHAIVTKKAAQLGFTLSHKGHLLEDLPEVTGKTS